MSTSLSHIAACAARIQSAWRQRPAVGIVLGSGLGDIADSMQPEAVVPFESLPNFPATSAIGHRGRFVCGHIGAVPVVIQQGRLHGYEGVASDVIGMPVRILQTLGIQTLILTNAAGGLRPGMCCGDVMLIDDHINLMGMNPLIGPNDESLGVRFPDMSSPYDSELLDVAEAAGLAVSDRVSRGTYLAMLGPCYETRAEYRMARHFGADAVGMSTVPEVLVARHAKVRVLAMSVISNVATDAAASETTAHAVLNVVQTTVPIVSHIFQSVVTHVGESRSDIRW